MIPKWRDILVGFLAERANSIMPTHISHPEAVFINRILDGQYPAPNTQEFNVLLDRMERGGFSDYAAAFYRRFLAVVDGYEYEIALTADGALALLLMAVNPEALHKATQSPEEP